MIGHNGRGFTGPDVDRLFRQAFRRGPWPDSSACESLSVIFNNVFQPREGEDRDVPVESGFSVQSFDDAELKRRRAAFRVLLNAIELPSADHLFSDPGEARVMKELHVALRAAEHYLIPRPRLQIQPWGVQTLVLASIVANFMRDAGYTHIGTNRQSRLAHFLELVLPRFVDDPPEREAIAAFLNKPGPNGASMAGILASGE